MRKLIFIILAAILMMPGYAYGEDSASRHVGKVLFIGDSMTGWLSERLEAYGAETIRGHYSDLGRLHASEMGKDRQAHAVCSSIQTRCSLHKPGYERTSGTQPTGTPGLIHCFA